MVHLLSLFPVIIESDSILAISTLPLPRNQVLWEVEYLMEDIRSLLVCFRSIYIKFISKNVISIADWLARAFKLNYYPLN